jgi:dUTP pyrophosphatase
MTGCYGRIAPRSSLAWKNHIDVGAGVVDADYRGNVGVVLFNHSDTDLEGIRSGLTSPLFQLVHLVTHGDRVAQLILEKLAISQVEEVDDLPDT